jgi:polyhydroxyalkanoate synthesis regulator phasin
MNKPYNFFEFWTKSLKEQTPASSPMQAYQDFVSKMMPQNSKQADMGSPEFLQQIFQQQMDMGKIWMQGVQSMFEQLAPKRKEANLFEQWSKMYGLWNNQYGKPFAGQMPRNDVAETFSNIMNFSQSYMEMYQLWQPLLEQLNMGKKPKKNALQEFMSNFSTEKYNEIVSNVFGSTTPKQSENFLSQIADFTNNLLDTINQQTGGGLEKMMQQLPDMLHQIQGTQYEALGKVQKGIAPFLKMIPDGKEKQLLELSIQVQDDYTFYYIKSNEMQNLVQKTAQKALETTLKNMLERVKQNPEQVITFEDFFNTWMDTTEPMMIELYRSPAFGKLQAEALAVSTAIKSRFEKQLELLLEPLPIAPRSEIDELNAIIHELRSKVRTLERELSSKIQDPVEIVKEEKAKTTKNTKAIEEAVVLTETKKRAGRPRKS